MQTSVIHAEVEFLSQPFHKPLQLSKGLITEATEARVSVTIRVGAREAIGRGSIYLSALWAWPDPVLTNQQRDGMLRQLCQHLADVLPNAADGEPVHPLELGLRLYERFAHHAPSGFESVPVLARAMCLSPFDAAIHDAVGRAMQLSAFDFYRQPCAVPSADALFAGHSATAAIEQVLRRPPQLEFSAWVLVGNNDDLEKSLAFWVRERRYRCIKLKILGRDNQQDVARTIVVYRTLRAWGVDKPVLSIDSNEANPDAASVLDYLRRLKEADESAFAALAYLEQPTGRDILEHRYDWREVSKLKPVMLDEGLTSLDILPEAKAQGWSGLALKTCKGHSFALVAAAWAKENNLLLSLQDLTNPGYAAIHAALFAAFVPTINGVELNSPQFTPAANAPWLPPRGRLAELLEPRDGKHRLPEQIPMGLGSDL